ncbi:MAG: homocitrate synthase, partial [Bradyrhizobium sp.]|nr:homocitrate synthase [Bradyrhizobium sp.]
KLSASAEEAKNVLARVRRHAVEHKGAVAHETVRAIWREVRERSLLNCA